MRSRASGGICGDSVAATSALIMSSLRRRAIWMQRARSAARSSTGGRASARTAALASLGSTSRRSHARTSRTSARWKNAAAPTTRNGTARSSSATATAWPSLRTDRTSTAMRSGLTPSRISRSTSAPTPCACARSFAQRQNATSPPGAPSTFSPRRSATGAVTARAARRMRSRERNDWSRCTTRACGRVAVKARRFLVAAPRKRLIAASSSPATVTLPCLRQELDQLEMGEVEVLVLVDQHVRPARAAAACSGGVGEQVDRAQDEVADVERALLGQQPVVVGEQLSELLLALGGLAVEVGGPGRVVGGGDELELAAVDALDDRGEQRGAVAEEVVAPQRELVDAVEQHRQAVGRGDGDEERVEPDRGGLLAQQAGGQVGDRMDGELAERLVERVLDLGAEQRRRGGRAGDEQQLLGRRAALGEPADALDEDARLARPGAAEDEQRAALVRHRLALGRGEVVEGAGHRPRISPRDRAPGGTHGGLAWCLATRLPRAARGSSPPARRAWSA